MTGFKVELNHSNHTRSITRTGFRQWENIERSYAGEQHVKLHTLDPL